MGYTEWAIFKSGRHDLVARFNAIPVFSVLIQTVAPTPTCCYREKSVALKCVIAQ